MGTDNYVVSIAHAVGSLVIPCCGWGEPRTRLSTEVKRCHRHRPFGSCCWAAGLFRPGLFRPGKKSNVASTAEFGPDRSRFYEEMRSLHLGSALTSVRERCM